MEIPEEFYLGETGRGGIGNSILQHSAQRPSGRPWSVTWFVLNLSPFLIFFASNSTFIVMFLTISILSICSYLEVCWKRTAEAVRFSCCFWDLPTLLIKMGWSSRLWKPHSPPKCSWVMQPSPKSRARLQRITFLFTGFVATPSQLKTFYFCKA